ncbi:hypothetical protein Q1695_010854 [Nippostrongylus brasiliensis]|nr:hypothetical protein Q1695_010854 [Nippostrongylus brasiliensis]
MIGNTLQRQQPEGSKTHTLTGSDCEKGIVQCTFDALFDAIAKSKDRNYMLRVSYVEIHDERVRDLLCHFAVTPVGALLATAQDHRQLDGTLLNERNSRSHTIIRITIESHDAKLGGYATRCSIMNLVDLAASANAASAGTQGLRQKQDSSCNSTDEALALRKEVAELNEVIERQRKALEVAEKHGEELRLAINGDDDPQLPAVNGRASQPGLLMGGRPHSTLKEDNIQLKNLRDEYRSQSANMKSVIEEKGRKISALIEQSEADKRKILRLDTDIAIAMIDRIQNESA